LLGVHAGLIGLVVRQAAAAGADPGQSMSGEEDAFAGEVATTDPDFVGWHHSGEVVVSTDDCELFRLVRLPPDAEGVDGEDAMVGQGDLKLFVDAERSEGLHRRRSPVEGIVANWFANRMPAGSVGGVTVKVCRAAAGDRRVAVSCGPAAG
jgi:hypothetical protein